MTTVAGTEATSEIGSKPVIGAEPAATITTTTAAVAVAAAAAGSEAGGSTGQARWEDWREASERQRREPYGFLAYSALHFLDSEPGRVEGFPGRWATGPQGPTVDLDEGESLLVDGESVTGHHAFGPVREREFRKAASFGDVVIELSRRGGNDLLRSLDPRHELRETYLATPTFAYDPAWVIQAELDPYPAPRPVEIAAAVDGIVHIHDAVGEAVFAIGGAEQRLIVLSGGPVAGGGLVLFTDETNGDTTYAAGRRLLVSLPAPGSTRIELDFNYAGNLQCTYTPYAPCPLAPARNRLPVAVEAGEGIPSLRPAAAG